jgi:hypothetical protein
MITPIKYGVGKWANVRSNWSRTRAEKAAKEILGKGIPRWASHPGEFKNWALECYARDKEESERQVAAYRLEEQETLKDHKARMVRLIGTREFIKKLRDSGVSCFTYQVPPTDQTPRELLNTVGLWCEVPSERGIGHLYRGIRHQYICYMDIPTMYEWSVLRTDAHDLPIGEAFRGWRTVLSQLIQKKVLTEAQAHNIFGPPYGQTSRVYRKTLYEFRNGRLKQNDRRLEATA